MYLPKGKYCVYALMVYSLAIVTGPPNRWPKIISIAFLAISEKYATYFFHKMAAGGHFR